MSSEPEASRLRRFLAHEAREREAKASNLRELADRVGVSHPTIIKMRKGGGAGRDVLKAIAVAWFGGSVDAIQTAADAWCLEHPLAELPIEESELSVNLRSVVFRATEEGRPFSSRAIMHAMVERNLNGSDRTEDEWETVLERLERMMPAIDRALPNRADQGEDV